MKKGILKAVAVGAIAATMGTAGATIAIKFGNEKNQQLSQEIKDLQKELDDAKLNVGGHTDEELEQAKEAVRKEEQAKTEEAVNQAKEETANNYKTILNILQSENRQTLERTDTNWNHIGKFLFAQDQEGLIYFDDETGDYSILKKTGKYISNGEINFHNASMYVFSSTENAGLFGYNKKNMDYVEYSSTGGNFQNILTVSDGELLAECRIENKQKVVDLKNGELTVLVDGENNVYLRGFTAFESGTNNLYMYNWADLNFVKADGIGVIITDIVDVGYDHFVLGNTEGKIAVYSRAYGYKESTIDGNFTGAFLPKESSFVFSTENALYRFELSEGTVDKLISDIETGTSINHLTLNSGIFYNAHNLNSMYWDLYFISSVGDANVVLADIVENGITVTESTEEYINFTATTKDGTTHDYKYTISTKELTQL